MVLQTSDPIQSEDVDSDGDKFVPSRSVRIIPSFFKNRSIWMVGLLMVPLLLWRVYEQRHRARDSLFQQCQQLQTEQKWIELRNVSERLSKLDPASADPWIFRAAACEGTKDLDGFVASIGRVPAQDPRAVDLQVRKMIVELNYLNRPWEGLKTCDRILEINPLVTRAHSEGINFCLFTLQRAEMVKRIRRAILCRRERPEDYVYLVSSSWMLHPAAFTANSHWLKSDPNCETFQVAQAMQVYYSNAKKSDQAERFVDVPPYEELLSRYPENLELLNFLMHTYIENGHLQGVEAVLSRVPKTVEADKDARFWRARAWCEDTKGNLSEAAELLQKAFQCDRYWWVVHYELHQVYRRLGQQELADRFYKVYDVGRILSERIAILNHYLNINHQDENIHPNHPKYLIPILPIAEMVNDWEVADAIRNRLSALEKL